MKSVSGGLRHANPRERLQKIITLRKDGLAARRACQQECEGPAAAHMWVAHAKWIYNVMRMEPQALEALASK